MEIDISCKFSVVCREFLFVHNFNCHESEEYLTFVFCLFCFVALRPKSTAMVMGGRSVHLTTLFPGQA